jgi:PAS domain S-box-containing protein
VKIRYRQLVESSLGFICTHDLDGILLSINSHAATTLGYEPEELIGTPLRNYIDPDHLAEYDAYFAALKQDRIRITRDAFICGERRASCASSPIATSCCSCRAWIRLCSATASTLPSRRRPKRNSMH